MNDRNIADARRLARKLARETGQPYQTMLDQVASNAGSHGWATFVLEPRPVVELAINEGDAAKPDPEKARRDQIDHIISSLFVMVQGCLAVAMSLLILWAAHDETNRVNLVRSAFGCIAVGVLVVPMLMFGRIFGFRVLGRPEKADTLMKLMGAMQVLMAILLPIMIYRFE